MTKIEVLEYARLRDWDIVHTQGTTVLYRRGKSIEIDWRDDGDIEVIYVGEWLDYLHYSQAELWRIIRHLLSE